MKPSHESLSGSPDALSHALSGRSSRLAGFYALPLRERREVACQFSGLTPGEAAALAQFGALTPELADVFIENAIGSFSLPLGIATNFRINGQDILVPMAVEETSVLAAASHGAKLARSNGGFVTASTEPIMTGQIQLIAPSPEGFPLDFERILLERTQEILRFANQGQYRLVERGGGAKNLTWRYIKEIHSLVLYLDVDTREAMGANIVNTMCEKVSTLVSPWFGGRIGLRILTNLTDKRMARASCLIKKEVFDSKEFCGAEVVAGIEAAYWFARHDVYRATTHNKGIMNGIDPVLIATGNDWRAVDAGAHAFACRTGVYQPLSTWATTTEGNLIGELELPMAVGTVGGVTKLHPTAQASLKLMGQPNARALSEIICAVGLAQNLSALRALASEGIQRGHMSLHNQNLSLQRQSPQKSETFHKIELPHSPEESH